jgi:predicted DNA-binding protein (UPF0251 family)/DNA-directed RNA polymerase subunit RPC12/RpoP
MSRPVKLRKIKALPIYDFFKPVSVPLFNLEQVDLKIEELEAMRLKDIEGLNQSECAKKMRVSRQTFQLIIDKARGKVTSALIEGKAIRIDGGHYTLNICTYHCTTCGEIYDSAYEQVLQVCPSCGSIHVNCEKKNHFCEKQCVKAERKEQED